MLSKNSCCCQELLGNGQGKTLHSHRNCLPVTVQTALSFLLLLLLRNCSESLIHSPSPFPAIDLEKWHHEQKPLQWADDAFGGSSNMDTRCRRSSSGLEEGMKKVFLLLNNWMVFVFFHCPTRHLLLPHTTFSPKSRRLPPGQGCA